MRFLIDMPLSPDLAEWLGKRGHDTVHAVQLGLMLSPDTELMDVAKREGRTIITADLDYPRLLALTQAHEPSVILFRDGDWDSESVFSRMRELLASIPEAEISQSVIVIERDRIRKRRLPLPKR